MDDCRRCRGEGYVWVSGQMAQCSACGGTGSSIASANAFNRAQGLPTEDEVVRSGPGSTGGRSISWWLIFGGLGFSAIMFALVFFVVRGNSNTPSVSIAPSSQDQNMVARPAGKAPPASEIKYQKFHTKLQD